MEINGESIHLISCPCFRGSGLWSSGIINPRPHRLRLPCLLVTPGSSESLVPRSGRVPGRWWIRLRNRPNYWLGRPLSSYHRNYLWLGRHLPCSKLRRTRNRNLNQNNRTRSPLNSMNRVNPKPLTRLNLNMENLKPNLPHLPLNPNRTEVRDRNQHKPFSCPYA
jgi:hypothetical protein